MTFLACGLTLLGARRPLNNLQAPAVAEPAAHSYLGFDLNQYPGDAALPLLRQTFSFSDIGLNAAPEESSNSWRGKREIVSSTASVFCVVQRMQRSANLSPCLTPRRLARAMASLLLRRRVKTSSPLRPLFFSIRRKAAECRLSSALIFTRGAMQSAPPGFGPASICRGIVVRESARVTITTADDLRDNAGARKIVYFVYNDACPPSPGCAFPRTPPHRKQAARRLRPYGNRLQSPRRGSSPAAVRLNMTRTATAAAARGTFEGLVCGS